MSCAGGTGCGELTVCGVVSRFFGIVIAIYFNDRAPAHFHAQYHAQYDEHKAKIDVATGAVLDGVLPGRVGALVEAWRQLHQAKIEEFWIKFSDRQPHGKIAPLE